MQDKEFDELFRSRLQHLEAEPSKGLWNNISAEVIIGRPNRFVAAWLSIAASVVLLIGAGVYFIPQVKKPASTDVVNVNHRPKQKIPQTDTRQDIVKEIPANRIAAVKQHKTKIVKPLAIKDDDVLPVTTQQQPAQEIAQAEPRTQEILKPAVPALETPLTAANELKENISVLASQPVIAALPQDAPKAVAAAPVKKRGIRSLGDLINVVVAKVDKRKDKIIEFANTDDDESTITGLNLGIVKIKAASK